MHTYTCMYIRMHTHTHICRYMHKSLFYLFNKITFLEDFYLCNIIFSIAKLYVSFSGYAKFNFVDVKSQSNGTSIYI